MHSVICSGLGLLECSVITKCTKFGQLILGRIIKIVATRCQILRLKCTKFDFSWGSVASAQTPLGELTALLRPQLYFRGPTSKGMEWKGRGRGGEGRGTEKGKGWRGKGKGGESVPLGLILQFDHW